jgi:hypothetical protein
VSWIESHQEIGQHPKTYALSTALNVEIPTAVGVLHLLWHFALKFAWKDGDLKKFTSSQIANGTFWKGNPDDFLKALQGTGWLDGKKVHDWMDYAGKIVHDRLYNKLRRKTPSNAVPRRKTLATLPNLTVPNRTLPNQKRKVLESNGKDFSPPNGSEEILEAVQAAVDFSGDEGSRAFFQKSVRSLGPEMVRQAIGDVKMRGDNVSSKSKYLCALLKDWMDGRGLKVSPRQGG